MNKNTKNRFATVVAAAAVLTVFGGGTAVAGGLITSAKIKNDTIRSIDLKTGSVRSVDILDNTVGSGDILDSSVGTADVRDGSLTNADISVFNATVKSDGTVAYSSGGVSVNHFAEGAYRLHFPRDVQECSVAITATSPDGPFAPQANFGTADVLNEPNQVVVAARHMTDNNDPIDVGFHAIVVC